MKLPINSAAVLKTRKDLGINQQAFWSKIKVTQSGGSRYETGRSIPASIQHMIVLAYGSQTEADKLVKSLRSPSKAA